MTRYVTPLLFVALTAYMRGYNQSHADRKLLIPFVDLLFPEIANDPAALGERSVWVAAGLTAVVTLWTLLEHVRAVRRRRLAQPDD